MQDRGWAKVESVALVRVGALGDLLVGLAAIHEAHELFPNARVTLIGPRLWTEILAPEKYPYIERIIGLEKRGAIEGAVYRVDSGTWRQEIEPQPLHQILRGTQAFVNFHIDSYRSGFTALRARIPIRIGATPAPMAWLYTHAAPFFGKDPEVHERDAALLILEAAESSAIKYFRTVERNRVNLSEWVGRSKLIAKWRAAGLPAGKTANLARASELTGCAPRSYVLVNPTSSRREKAWPSEKFRELLLSVRDEFAASGAGTGASANANAGGGAEILVLGAPNETDWLREVAGSEFRIVQPPNIFDLQDVVAGARGLLTNTSSVQFIAAMAETPAIVLMGRGNPEIWGPLGPRDKVIRGRPPEDLAHDIFKQEEAAYQSIEIAEVRAAFQDFGPRA
jgi:ADP-heptose:LPS heptosyltransferase